MLVKFFRREKDFPELEVLIPDPFHPFAVFDVISYKFYQSDMPLFYYLGGISFVNRPVIRGKKDNALNLIFFAIPTPA